MWGTATDGNPMMIDLDAFAGGAAAVAERLWSDPPPGADIAAEATAAEARYHSHLCHWSIWGVATYQRAPGGSLSVQEIPVQTASCPSQWSQVPV